MANGNFTFPKEMSVRCTTYPSIGKKEIMCTNLENTTRLAMEESLHRWEESLPENYCRLDERYEPCKGGIPLPYDPTIPPVKVGPPVNVTYEIGFV